MSRHDHPEGFKPSKSASLGESAGEWVIGTFIEALEDGVAKQAAAYHKKTDDLFLLCPEGLDDGIYYGYDLCKLQPGGSDPILPDSLPGDVRVGLFRQLEKIVHSGDAEIALHVEDRITGTDKRFDSEVREATRNFDARQLLPPELTAEEDQKVREFGSHLNGREGELAISRLAMEDAASHLREAETRNPEDTFWQDLLKQDYYRQIDKVAGLEPKETPSYGYEVRHVDDASLTEVLQRAETSERDAVRRARKWADNLGDKPDDKDKGKGV